MATKSAFIYILQCSDNTLYTGWTFDLESRLAKHSSGRGARYTRCRLPVKMVYYEELPNRSLAQKRECEIKAMSRSGKLKLIHAR